jgi:hypothetical protein
MQRSVDASGLNRADRIIRKFDLHSGPDIELRAVIEHFASVYTYVPMPALVVAITARWKGERRHYIRMRFNDELREPTESARDRHAQAHELAHVILRHRGDFWVMWEAGGPCPGFWADLESLQERQCEYLAAYLLIPLRDLVALKNETQWYIARTLDVPEHLVELRWVIFRKFGK